MLLKLNKFWQDNYAVLTLAGYFLGFSSAIALQFFDEISFGNISDFAVAGATIVLAVFTWLLWSETARSRHHNQSAHIVLTIEEHQLHKPAMLLVLENVGMGIARDIQIDILDQKETEFVKGKKDDKHFTNVGFLSSSIPLMKAGSRVEHFCFMYWDIANPKGFEILTSIKWIDYAGSFQQTECKLNLDYFEGTTTIGSDPVYEIAKHQKKIADAIGRVSRLGRLEVNVYSEEDRQERRKQDQMQIDEHYSKQKKAK